MERWDPVQELVRDNSQSPLRNAMFSVRSYPPTTLSTYPVDRSIVAAQTQNRLRRKVVRRAHDLLIARGRASRSQRGMRPQVRGELRRERLKGAVVGLPVASPSREQVVNRLRAAGLADIICKREIRRGSWSRIGLGALAKIRTMEICRQ